MLRIGRASSLQLLEILSEPAINPQECRVHARRGNPGENAVQLGRNVGHAGRRLPVGCERGGFWRVVPSEPHQRNPQ